ncbi:NAD(P)-dependent oxidoreductase [Ornithinimicrobium avium]|uniref:NAD-dependent epimerase/dehydratase family protein n=1 Tax=Ornithinimicrobium avium TaxID=2283195 RepID=A0A345NQ18_9MICO|nr:NAD-dependent epimerase/dehydratase family protein [Ornithinimicrobium avium]
MATIALFGATGRTGGRVLHRALDAGHAVRELVRDPAKLDHEGDDLSVIRGDVLDPASVARAVSGADVVLSLFGQVKGPPRTLQTDGTRIIVDAMRAAGVRRIVTLSGGGLRAPQDRPGMADRGRTGPWRPRAAPVVRSWSVPFGSGRPEWPAAGFTL